MRSLKNRVLSDENQTSDFAKPRLADARIIPILFSTPMVQALLDGTKTQTRRIVKPKYSNTDIEWKIDKYGKRLVERQNDVPEPKVTISKDGKTSTVRHFTMFSEIKKPYKKGDILWVRETFEYFESTYDSHGGLYDKTSSIRIQFKADRKISSEILVNKLKAINAIHEIETSKHLGKSKFRPSIFMPKEACRLFLKVKSVRAERLQEICSTDAVSEGIMQSQFVDELVQFNCYECDKKGHVAGKDLCNDGFFFQSIDSFKSLWKSINGNESWEINPWVWVIEFERTERPTGFC